MKIQAVMAACFGVAAIAATGCATSGPAPASPLHASAPAMPTSLSRQQLARSFHRQTAQPVSVKPGADPSFALVHETAELRPDETSGAHAQERRASKIPLRRVADPQDMANVVSFIVGPDAAYVSGADIVVDGGLVNTLMPNLGMSNNWNGKVTG